MKYQYFVKSQGSHDGVCTTKEVIIATELALVKLRRRKAAKEVEVVSVARPILQNMKMNR